MLIVVRHAHAGSRSAWTEDDALRPLSDRGWAQARAIAPILAEHGPTRLLSSPKIRCRETLQPLGELVGVDVEIEDRLDEGSHPLDLLALFDELAGSAVALSSHGDVIPDLLFTLQRDRALDLPAQVTWQKGSAWLIDPEAMTGTFVPTPPV